MIEVFKTNVAETEQAEELLTLLKHRFPGSRINIDLHDCDKVLRVEGTDFIPITIIDLLHENGYSCCILD